MSNSIVAFYHGTGRDGAGRLIYEVWRFDDDEIEGHHDFIQWLFPLPDPSAFNPAAPLLTPEVAVAFHRTPELTRNLLRSLDMMLRFYGLKRNGTAITRAADFEERQDWWLMPDDHNHLRLTRIMLSLAHLALPDEAAGLRKFLVEDLSKTAGARISTRTLQIWKALNLQAETVTSKGSPDSS